MNKVLELLKKFSAVIMASATAYFFLLGFFGKDLIFWTFTISGLEFVIRILYIIIGLVGMYKLLEMYKPDILEKILGKMTSKKTPKK